jgi:hypothetical protein
MIFLKKTMSIFCSVFFLNTYMRIFYASFPLKTINNSKKTCEVVIVGRTTSTTNIMLVNNNNNNIIGTG